MKRVLCTLSFFFFLTVAMAQWTRMAGPEGGDVRSLLMTSDGRIFAGTVRSGLLRSDDNGLTWEFHGLEDKRVFGIVETQTGALLAATGEGVFRSPDGGETWVHIPSADVQQTYNVTLMVKDQYVFAASRDEVVRSADDGATWVDVSAGLELGADSYSSMASNDGYVFIYTNPEGVYRSDDYGDHWTLTSTGLPDTGTKFSLTYAGGYLFTAVNGDVYRTANNGDSWEISDTGLGVQIRDMAGSGSLLMASNSNNIYRSEDSGNSWELVALAGEGERAVAFLFLDSEVIIGTDRNGIYRSSDKGETWTVSNTGFVGQYVHCLAAIGEHLIAGTGSNGIYRTSNAETWTHQAYGRPVYDLLAHGSSVFAAVNSFGVGRSDDQGNAWAPKNNGVTFTTATGLHAKDDKIFVAAQPGMFVSTNNGEEWTRLNLNSGFYNNVAALGDDLYAGTGTGLFVSHDGGDTWADIHLSNSLFVYALHAIGDTALIVSMGGEVYRTVNGSDFTEVDVQSDILFDLIATGNTVYAATEDGLRFSRDGGASWRVADAGLTATTLRALAVHDSFLYAGSNNGAWKRMLNPHIGVDGVPEPFVGPVGLPSETQRITVTAEFASSDITITAPPGFEVSTDSDTGFSATCVVTGEDLVSYEIYVRLNNESLGVVSGNLIVFGEGLDDVVVPVVGEAVKRVPQIAFEINSPVRFNHGPIALTASSDSPVALNYSSSNENVATIEENIVTIVGTGTTSITASQGEGEIYTAGEVVRDLVVEKADQVITFGPLAEKKDTDEPFELTASSGSSLPVSYSSSQPAVASVSGNVVTVHGIGSTAIFAAQAGNDNYNPAETVSQLLTVKAAQTITFADLPVKKYGDAPFTLEASASSSLPVTFSSSDPLIATVEGDVVTIHGAGATVITAGQEGSVVVAAADVVERVLTIDKAGQTIAFEEIGDHELQDESITLEASASSGLAVVFSTADDNVILSGNELSFSASGRVIVHADQSGDNNYEPAPRVSQTFCIIPFAPVIAYTDGLLSADAVPIQWYLNGAAIEGAIAQEFEPGINGIYTATTTVDDCVSTPSNEIDVVVTGLEPWASHDAIVHPNPARDHIVVDLSSLAPGIPLDLRVYHVTGKLVDRFAGEGGAQLNLSVKHYPVGLYTIMVIGHRRIIVGKVVKE